MQPAAQLLVDMPAESAARLLTLSLLEQLTMHAALDAYRSGLNRLGGCITLYEDVLDGSVSPKVRRRLRELTDATNELYDVETVVAWLATMEHSPPAALTAGWLRDRLVRRRGKLSERLPQLRENSKPLRRLAKRLGVYTTAVRLDDVSASVSFGELTAQRLLDVADRLRGGVLGLASGDDVETLRRVERTAEHLVYLLEPVGTRSDVERPASTARELRSDIGRLRVVALKGEALIRGGRRIGARQMMARMYHTIWPDVPTPPGTEGAPRRHRYNGLPNDLALGLTALAERLRDESADELSQFIARWPAGLLDVLLDDVAAVARALRAR